MNTTKFQEAQEYFGRLEETVALPGLGHPAAFGADRHFAVAAHAVAVLYSLGVDQLRELVRQDIVHPSTILGGSLGTAMRAVNDYQLEKRWPFHKDEYEQLDRVCYSAKRFLDLVEGNYTPAF